MRSRAARGDGRGMVTAELAVAMLAAFTCVVMLCSGIGLLVTQMRCIDTAGEVARQAARNDDEAVREAKREAPQGAEITSTRRGDRIDVEVRLRAEPLGGWLPPVDLRARAEVVAEPGGAP